MSWRGRTTLAVLGFATAFGVAALTWSPGPAPLPDDPQTAAAVPRAPLPAVSARGPSRGIPASIASRVPVHFGAEIPETHPWVEVVDGGLGDSSAWRVEYTLDPELMRRTRGILKRGRVSLGHVIVLDPASGRVLAYASTDLERFPPTRAYPAASLMKIITAAAALHHAPKTASDPCHYRGSPYRLTAQRLDPPAAGNTVSLERALATSNNQCFAQLAVHQVGEAALVDAITRFGWLSPAGPGHDAGSVDTPEDRLDLGKLGCGLAGCRITPLHAAQLAGALAHGQLVEPYWVARAVDSKGVVHVPDLATPRRVLTPELSEKLRAMLVKTTTNGTARRAFRTRRGKLLLDPVRVAGKTGSLSGRNPTGRYEWFTGVAPADKPRVAVAVLLVQNDLWWVNASQVAAEVFRTLFCPKGVCRDEAVNRWLEPTIPASPPSSARDVAVDADSRGDA